MIEHLRASAIDAGSMIRRNEVSSRELTEAMLARIDQANPTVNAVVELRAELALEEAAVADRRTEGHEPGPLHGVPITVKDSLDVTGMHTTWGNPAFRDHVATADATVVQRLRRAGAIVVGKTNVHFMLGDFAQTANDLYGVTNNPWDPTRTPGGSSGGGAAALACGMTFLELGSDLVGSVRIPATFCGVYGLKPSVGVMPLAGFQVPGAPAGPTELLHLCAIGPLARSAGDLRAALTVTAGPEGPAANAYSWRLAPPRHARLRDFRVGVVLDHPNAPVSSDVAARLAATVDGLVEAGATVVEGWPPGVDAARDFESFGFQVGLFFAYQDAGSEPAVLAGFVEQEIRRMATRAAWGRYFEDVDVFLCPANFTAAFTHDVRPFEERMITTSAGEVSYASQPFWSSHASLSGLPAVVAPVGVTAAGLPVGVQVIGPLHEDDTAITFAELLAEVIGGFEPPPGTSS
ncbi:MAG: amidase [Actinomycetia bacterium]|nr:amidase [Actinomycetes bacterium]